MALADEIRALADRTLKELDAIHNFVDHTGLVWRTFQLWVQDGHVLEATNVETGMKVNERELVHLSEHYKNEYVLALTFQHYVAVFEAFFFDFLKLLLVDDPRRLAQKKQIDVKTLLAATDRQSLVSIIADHELNELKYKRVAEWCECLKRLVNINCPTETQVGMLAEIKASRDILVHNASNCESDLCGQGGAAGAVQGW